MPILNADQAHTVMVLKRTLNPGFAGEDNDLFYAANTMMIFGDAKATLTTLNHLLQQAGGKGDPQQLQAPAGVS
jgi:NAD(P) transhydrogenase subunit beta